MNEHEPDVLENIWVQELIQRSETRTLRHEAAHAAAACCLADAFGVPFTHVEVGTIGTHTLGIVPGCVGVDLDWFKSLPSLDQAAIRMAGLYYQDEISQPTTGARYSGKEWRQLLDSLDGGDGTDDYADATNCREPETTRDEFDEAIRRKLESLRPRLDRIVEVIARRLRPGTRVAAEELAPDIERARNVDDGYASAVVDVGEPA